MKKIKSILLLSILFFSVMLFTMPTSAEAENDITLVNDVYRVRIEASQWEYKAFDLNVIEAEGVDMTPDGDDKAAVKRKASFELKHRIHFKEGGKTVEFELVTRDVQHGFSINELGIAIALNRPTPGNEFGAPIYVSTDLPDTDITYSAFCHIFCGLGHPDMKIKLVVEDGDFELGPYIFYAALLLNIAIFGVTIRSIMEKVSLIEDES